MKKTYPCPRCKTRHDADDLDDYTGLCPACREPAKPPSGSTYRACAVCGKAIAGYANRRTCSAACRVALHRARRRSAHKEETR